MGSGTTSFQLYFYHIMLNVRLSCEFVNAYKIILMINAIILFLLCLIKYFNIARHFV